MDCETAARTRTLLTHHRTLDKWLQLGGHADGDPDLLAVALREGHAGRESGLTRLRVRYRRRFFDLRPSTGFPERKTEPAHWHHDFRFMIEADPGEPLAVSDESRRISLGSSWRA